MWLGAVMEYLQHNRDRVVAKFAEVPGITCRSPQATYLAWLDMRASGLGDDPSAAIAERANVTLLPGPDFGPAGKGHARLNFATTAAVLDEALDRIAALFAAD